MSSDIDLTDPFAPKLLPSNLYWIFFFSKQQVIIKLNSRCNASTQPKIFFLFVVIFTETAENCTMRETCTNKYVSNKVRKIYLKLINYKQLTLVLKQHEDESLNLIRLHLKA